MRRSIQESGVRSQNSGTGACRLHRWRPDALVGRLFVLALLLSLTAKAAPEGEARFERTFADASRAYDENRLPEAIGGWESLVDAGQRLPEVWFNLGNAYYRNGNIGKAILAYRQAQRLAPRDPDIRANLGFAAQSAGIALPARKPIPALLLDISQAEWRMLGSVLFWLLTASLAAWILWPRVRFVTRPAAAGLAVLLLVALAGLWMYRDLRQSPECVVMDAGQKVLSSPLESATPLLAIPEGAIVRRLDDRANWIEVRQEATRGWLPAAALAPVR